MRRLSSLLCAALIMIVGVLAPAEATAGRKGWAWKPKGSVASKGSVWRTPSASRPTGGFWKRGSAPKSAPWGATKPASQKGSFWKASPTAAPKKPFWKPGPSASAPRGLWNKDRSSSFSDRFWSKRQSQTPSVKKTISLSKSRNPEAAQHIEDAQKQGKPQIVTVNRAGAAKNRKASLLGVPTVPGKDRDEYPPAMFKEGGTGASVRHIAPSDNRSAGACIGQQCQGLKDGDKVRIEVKP